MNELTMPVTGGFFSTNMIIVLVVAVVFVIGYVLYCILRENKSDELKGFSDDDFVDEDQYKQ